MAARPSQEYIPTQPAPPARAFSRNLGTAEFPRDPRFWVGMGNWCRAGIKQLLPAFRRLLRMVIAGVTLGVMIGHPGSPQWFGLIAPLAGRLWAFETIATGAIARSALPNLSGFVQPRSLGLDARSLSSILGLVMVLKFPRPSTISLFGASKHYIDLWPLATKVIPGQVEIPERSLSPSLIVIIRPMIGSGNQCSRLRCIDLESYGLIA